jgi:hypothetical protein
MALLSRRLRKVDLKRDFGFVVSRSRHSFDSRCAPAIFLVNNLYFIMLFIFKASGVFWFAGSPAGV